MIAKSQLVEHEGKMAYKTLLPKGWELSDYSPTENLIELEDTKTGDRPWFTIHGLFRGLFSAIGEEKQIVQNGSNIRTGEGILIAKLERISAVIERKRCHLIAVLNITPADLEAAAL